MADAVTEIQMYQEVRDRILDTRRRIEKSFVEFAEQLYDIWSRSLCFHWGFDSFRDYVETELGVKYRRAKYLVSIASAVHELGLDWDDIQAIGWTKARSLLPFLRNNGNPAEYDGWIEYAQESTVRELEDRMRSGQLTETTETEVDTEPRCVTYKMELSIDQSQLFNDCMEHAKRLFEVDTVEEAVESILYDWMMRAGTSPERLDEDAVGRWYQSTFGTEVSS